MAPAGSITGTHAASPRVSIVIPVFNRWDMTQLCLESLAATVDLSSTEIIVIDNGSSDATQIELPVRFPWVVYERNAVNQGYAIACNQGARRAGGEILMMVNNDIEARPGWLAPLVKTLEEDPGVGAVGSLLLYPGGELIQHAGVLLYEDTRPGAPHCGGAHRWHRQVLRLVPDALRNATLQAVTGAVMALRAEDYAALGGLDESYWNGNEDIDLCLRLGRAGFSIAYRPDSRLIHHESASGPERFARVTENILRFTQTWRGAFDPDFMVTPIGTRLGGGSGRPGPCDPQRVGAPPLALPPAGMAPARSTSRGLHEGTPSPRAATGRIVAWDAPFWTTQPTALGYRAVAGRLAKCHGVLVVPTGSEVPEILPGDEPGTDALAEALRESEGVRADSTATCVTVSTAASGAWAPPVDNSVAVLYLSWQHDGVPTPRLGSAAEYADEIWVPSTAAANLAVAGGLSAGRIRVIPQVSVVPAEEPSAGVPEAPPALRQSVEAGLRLDAATRLLYVGPATHRGGLDLALTAFASAFGPDDDVSLTIRLTDDDGGAVVPAVYDMVRRLGERPDVARVQPFDEPLSEIDLMNSLQGFTALVSPHRLDLMGTHLVLAAAAGLQIVTSNSGAALDLEPIGLGALERIPVDESGEPQVAALERALKALAADPSRDRPEVGQLREHIRRTRSPEAIAELIASRVEALAGGPPVRSDPDALLHPGAAPAILDDLAQTAVLIDLEVVSDWREVLERWLGAMGSVTESTLVIAVHGQEQTEEVAEALSGTAVDALAFETGGDLRVLAGAYVACDRVLVGSGRRARDRAERMGKAVLDGSSPDRLLLSMSDLGVFDHSAQSVR